MFYKNNYLNKMFSVEKYETINPSYPGHKYQGKQLCNVSNRKDLEGMLGKKTQEKVFSESKPAY